MRLFGTGKKNDAGGARRLFDAAVAQGSSTVQILVRVADSCPVYISPNFEHLFGIPAARYEDDAETLLRFIPETDRIHLKRLTREWDGISSASCTYTYRRPGGIEREIRIRQSTEPVLDGEYLLVEMCDITSEADRIAAVEAERDHALKTAADRTDFMSQMSHEIRTPLNGIEGMLSLARDHYADEERLLDDLSRASQLSGYLLTLINDVLDMSRLNSGRVKLDIAPFDLRVLARELREMFEGQAADKGLSYSVELEDCENVYLVGDRMRVSQIVINFISNALKFTDRGGSVTVTFREMHRTEDTVSYMLRVRDTGKGMDPRYISKIFKPFEQEDRTIARRYGGTGLGMAITSSLVDLMGGQIVVDTEPGRGSTFSAYIGFGVASAEQVRGLADAAATLETIHDVSTASLDYVFDGKRFLLAEDNEINALIVAEMLGKRGVAVDRADNGMAVIERFESMPVGTYDAILMDIQMPVLNGWEASERIRALDREDAATVPIIALSANDYTEDVKRSRAAGMNGHVGKPIDFMELKAQLAAATAESAYRGSR